MKKVNGSFVETDAEKESKPVMPESALTPRRPVLPAQDADHATASACPGPAW